MSHEHVPFGWPSLITSIMGAGITIADVNAVVTLLVGLATLVFTCVKIYQALTGATRDREAIRKLLARMRTTTEPGDLR